jgi:hypothetical protein
MAISTPRPGGLVELTTKVVTGELDNGFALIRYAMEV